MSAIVYMAECKSNSKKYIGFTTKSLLKRSSQHKCDARKTDGRFVPFHNAIRHHGFDSFTFKVLARGTKEEMLFMEKIFIKAFDTQNREVGYNVTSGGEGRTGCPPWNKGIPHSDDAIQKMRQAAIGKKQSPNTVAKRVAKTKGMVRSQKTKDKMAGEWEIQTPHGETIVIKNLQEFCRNNNLIMPNMIGVANGQRKQHKGFTCKRKSLSVQSRRASDTAL